MIATLDVDRIIADAIASRESWEPLLPSRRNGYSRSRLVATDEYELLAVLWAPGAATPIHDHGDSFCATRILRGELDVTRYDRIDDLTDQNQAQIVRLDRILQRIGDGDALAGARELHKVTNQSNFDTLSLHVYAPALTSFRIFDSAGRVLGVGLAHIDASFT